MRLSNFICIANYRNYLPVFMIAVLTLLGSITVSAQQSLSMPILSSAAWHPTANLVAIGTNDYVAIFDGDLQLINTLPFVQDEIRSIPYLGWNADGTMLALAISFDIGNGLNTRLIVWEVDPPNIVLDLTDVSLPISWSKDSQNSQFIATTRIYDRSVLDIYDVSLSQIVSQYAHNYGIYFVDWNPTDINQMAIGDGRDTRIINPLTLDEITSLPSISGESVFGPDGRLAGHAPATSEIVIFENTLWTPQASVPIDAGVTDNSIEWTTTGVVFVNALRSVQLWEPNVPQLSSSFTLADDESPLLFWKPDGSLFLRFERASDNADIYVCNGSTGQVLAQFPPNRKRLP